MRFGLTFVAAVALLGCDVRTKTVRAGPSSFKVDIVCAGASASDCPAVPAGAFVCPKPPAVPNLGSPVQPVDRNQTFYLAQATTLDSTGQPFTDYQATANVYLQFEGSVTPTRSAQTAALAQLPFHNGTACLALVLPPAFNPTTIWVEDPVAFTMQNGLRQPSSSYALGASQAIYRPAPLVEDVQRTTDPVFQTSALNNKHVIIESGQDGAPLVVTYVSTNYFTVTDLGATGPDHAWGSIELYTFSQPYGVAIGSVVSHLNGSVQNYLGLPELNFPVWTLEGPPGTVPVPTPRRLYHRDIPNTIGAMAPYKSGIVEVVSDASDTWLVCPLRGTSLASYYKYGEWLIATPTSDCSNFNETLDVVTTASIPNFDPVANAGKKLCSLGGILSVVVPAAHVNLWTITPRGPTDLGAVRDISEPCP